jgi:hypothetical protein
MANDTTPLMLITNVGLAAASTALPEGPYIHIIKFEIGSAYGYTPDVNQTQLQGNILYGGDPNPANWAKPSDYVSIGNNTLNIILEIPPEAGPWEFGEVGIFAADSAGNPYLFAVAVFQSPQTKFSSLGTNVVSSYQLNCLLKLQQSTAIFQIDTGNQNPDVYDIYQWSDVYPPSISANPDIPSYNIREPNSRGDGTMLITTTDSVRTLVDSAYQEIFPDPFNGSLWTVANSSATYVEITQAQFNAYRANYGANRSLLVQTHAGFWRSVSGIAVSGGNYRLNLNCTNDGTYTNYPLPVVPQLGESLRIYSDSFEGKLSLYDQIVNPPAPPPIASVGTPGLAYGGAGTYMPGGGVIQAFGMLQNPSSGTGRLLTAVDDLNSDSISSGLYYAGAQSGFPANMPVQINSNIWVHNIGNGVSGAGGSDITQIVFPWNVGGGDAQGNNGYPPYWRQGYNSGANWTNWFPINVIGKQGGGSNGTTTVTTIPNSFSQTITTRCHIHIWLGDGSPNNTTALYKNGVIVSRNTKGGGSGYGRIHHDHCLFFPGDVMQYVTTGGVGSPITMVTDTF